MSSDRGRWHFHPHGRPAQRGRRLCRRAPPEVFALSRLLSSCKNEDYFACSNRGNVSKTRREQSRVHKVLKVHWVHNVLKGVQRAPSQGALRNCALRT